MNSLSSPNSSALVASAPADMTRDQLELLKRTIARGTTDDEFSLFLEACKRRRMDPFSKLIYPVKRWDAKSGGEIMSLQSSIDAFRLVADRSSSYAGQVGPHWCGKDGVWRDVWLDEAPPAAARVGVNRREFKEPLYAIALWSNYAQRDKQGNVTRFWKNMGPLMLAKCAEALALRRAFPEDLAGLYTSDEMEQAQAPAREPELVDMKTGEVLPATVEPAQPKRIDASSGREVVWDSKDPNPVPTVFHHGSWEWQPGVHLDTAIPIKVGTWASWRDEPLPAGKLKARCNPPTWRTAAQGQKAGGRHNLLLSIVSYFLKTGKPLSEAPIEYQRAACTLAALLAGIEKVPSEEPEPEPLFQDLHPQQDDTQ